MTTYITYTDLLEIEQKRRQKTLQMAANYVGTNAADLLIKRRLEAIEKRLRRMRYGLNDHEKDVVQRWNARKQQRLLQQYVQLGETQTPRKM